MIIYLYHPIPTTYLPYAPPVHGVILAPEPGVFNVICTIISVLLLLLLLLPLLRLFLLLLQFLLMLLLLLLLLWDFFFKLSADLQQKYQKKIEYNCRI